MSLLERSFSDHSLVTVSIHYYERDDYKVSRLAVRMDTCSLVVVITVPKPVEGLLVVSANAFIHLDQGPAGMGVAPLDIALEGSEHVFLAPDQILFTLRNGDMYLVELQQEGRSLSAFKIEKVGTGKQTSCKCSLGHGYFFVGSRYADTMLIKYSTKDQVKA
ncbi:MAG: hypothetical protein J3Q66DRAFT_361132 [Benniella sp.]|nr:MAG: hypothetical protein J3Q66DRAFT_361132 [Benniella sp.]